jgi:hypothetical protein
MSLTVLGGLCGVSGAYLSMVENGKRILDRWSTILALTGALESTSRRARAGNEDAGGLLLMLA